MIVDKETSRIFGMNLQRVLEGQGWKEHGKPCLSDEGKPYDIAGNKDVVSLLSPNELYYGNVWYDDGIFYVMSGDAKYIFGNMQKDGYLTNYPFRELIALRIFNYKNIEELITEDLLKERL